MAETTQAERGAFENAMRWVGDLDHSFYDDERQRHVWYEAAMIGFQLLVILQLLATGIVMIVVGPGSDNYWLLGIGPVFIATIITGAYASKKGAPYTPGLSDLKGSRGIFGAGLCVLYLVGVFRMNGAIGTDGAFDTTSSIIGFIVGIVFGVLLLLGLFWAFKRFARSDLDDDLDDDLD